MIGQLLVGRGMTLVADHPTITCILVNHFGLRYIDNPHCVMAHRTNDIVLEKVDVILKSNH